MSVSVLASRAGTVDTTFVPAGNWAARLSSSVIRGSRAVVLARGLATSICSGHGARALVVACGRVPPSSLHGMRPGHRLHSQWWNSGSAVCNNTGDTGFLVDPSGNVVGYVWVETASAASGTGNGTSSQPKPCSRRFDRPGAVCLDVENACTTSDQVCAVVGTDLVHDQFV